MSAELTLLFLEKRVEASRLCASITEPFATGSEPVTPDDLSADFMQIVKEMEQTLAELKKLNAGLEKDRALEAGDIRHVRGRIETAMVEVARAAQDFSAQIRFFEAMNPNDAAKTKPALDKFDEIEKSTRDFTVTEGPEEGAELAPADWSGADVDPEPVDRHLRPDPDDRAARRGQWHSGPPGADRGAWGELGDHVAAHEGLDEVGDGASRQAGRLGDLGARDGRLRLEDVRKDESEVVLTDELLPGWLGAPGAARAAAASACGRGALRRRCPRHVATR